MKAAFLIFIAALVTVLGLSAFYVGVRVLSWSPWAAQHSALVWLSLSIVVALQFLGPVLYRTLPNHLNRLFVLHWISYTALGVFTCMFLYIVAADVLAALWTSVFRSDATEIESLAVAAMILATVAIGSLQVALGPKVYELEIPLRNLPPAFDGFRIVQISDMHLGPTIGRRYMQRCVRIANALDADIVALTGDFVDGSVALLRDAIAPVATLKSKQGIFFVTGNHEYYWGAQEWVAEFQRLGARVLLNEHVTLRKNGSELVLAGITDYNAAQILPEHASDPAKALTGAPEHAVNVLLAHHPKSHAAASRAGFHLQLSGHTHGGQFFPFSLVVRLAQRYYKGLYKHEHMWLYVSRGTGYWGPPLRFGVPAEIGLIKLRRA